MAGKKSTEATDVREQVKLFLSHFSHLRPDDLLHETQWDEAAAFAYAWHPSPFDSEPQFHYRPALVALAAMQSGWLGGETSKDSRVAGRVSHQLLDAAKARSGITSTSALLEYALAKVAVEDDFGEFLLSQAGTIDPDLDLEF